MSGNVSQRLDRIDQLLRQLADQQAAIMKQLRSTSGGGSRVPERKNPPLVELPACTCVSGWVMDEDGSVTRCPCSIKEGS